MKVAVLLPGALHDVAAGARRLDVEVPSPATLTDLLEVLGRRHPALVRRLVDETGGLRPFVNVFVDGSDVRSAAGLETMVTDGTVVQVLPSIAGG